MRRRVLASSFTFFFWVPSAVQIVYLYLTNAYSGDDFVSHGDLDSDHVRLEKMRESVSAELIKLARNSSLHDLRETVDRYAGLADALRSSGEHSTARHELFAAAGRGEHALGSLCLMRRNLRRLQRHHIQARRDFVLLFEQQADRYGSVSDVIGLAIDLARQVEDAECVSQLSALNAKKVEVWTSAQQEQHRGMTVVPPIAMTASLNND